MGCDLIINSSHVIVDANGGTARIDVNAGPYCPWVAKSSVDWLQLLQGAAQGNGAVVIAAGPNTGSTPRTAVVNVLGRSIQILQKAPAPASAYSDVAASSPLLDYIAIVKQRGAIRDCGSVFAAQFCPDYPVTHAEMAEMIVRAKLGTDSFDFPSMPYFTDVPPAHPQFKYIQKLADSSAIQGIFGAQFVPDAYTPRSLAAQLVMRAKYDGILPTTRAVRFTDLAPEFAVEAHKMHDLGITSGCTATRFCPGIAVSRGQMAVFLARAFLTPLGVWEK